MEHTILFLFSIGATILFGALAAWCFISKSPVHFMGAPKLLPEQIKDIKRFNFLNGIIWGCYCFFYLLISFIGLANAGTAMTLMVLSVMPGFLIAIIAYNVFLKQFKK